MSKDQEAAKKAAAAARKSNRQADRYLAKAGWPTCSTGQTCKCPRCKS